jgi:hypothetical protein
MSCRCGTVHLWDRGDRATQGESHATYVHDVEGATEQLRSWDSSSGCYLRVSAGMDGF